MSLKFKKLGFGSVAVAMPLAVFVPLAVSSCDKSTVQNSPDNVQNSPDNVQNSADKIISDRISSFNFAPNELAKQKTAWGWRTEDITDQWFNEIPVSGNGVMVKIMDVDNFPDGQKIDVTIQFSTVSSNHVLIVKETKIYELTGFRKETIDDKVDRLYGNTKIIPSKEAIQIPAMKENWPIESINDTNFSGLPKSQEDVTAKLLDIAFDDTDPLQGKIILNYEFSMYEGINTVTRKFVISGFEKATYNSNVAAQNHYKLVALYRMIDVKEGVDRSKISTDEFEEETGQQSADGMAKVKQVFNLPADRQYNTVTLLNVSSSSDNTEETYHKGSNMRIGSVKFTFKIFDWVNNKSSIVESEVFENFENPLNHWSDLFKKRREIGIKAISDRDFSIEPYYGNLMEDKNGAIGWKSSVTIHEGTGAKVLNATNKKDSLGVHAQSYLLPLSDWVGYKRGTYGALYGNGWNHFGLTGERLDHQRFVNMITHDAKRNYIGKGPNMQHDITTPINKGGVTEVLRKFIFDNIKNQELYQFDWIAYKNILEPRNASESLDWWYTERDGIPFGSSSVWIKTGFEYDIWLDYERITVTFDVSLGMVDAAGCQGGGNDGWVNG